MRALPGWRGEGGRGGRLVGHAALATVGRGKNKLKESRRANLHFTFFSGEGSVCLGKRTAVYTQSGKTVPPNDARRWIRYDVKWELLGQKKKGYATQK